ncbi:MAG: HAD-IIIA family hydrolase [Desulfuromonadales bacterium]|jgi:3-deoxy-D-manno-octulosonate 8-phosphate phosphatase (KDO 8-P phosphatase)|nr:HAD-IIIA family hydrolase [Desulfuromonadales bacterium]
MVADLAKIKLLLLDVDGVMTDGRIIYDNDGGETKAFDVKDGHGLKLLQRAGIRVGIITGRQSAIVAKRAAELGIELVYQGAKDKSLPFNEIMQTLALKPEEIAYVGDDIVDLPVMRKVGFAATVADAVDDVKPFADLVTKRPGGRGAVREICDFLLKESGRWPAVTRHYFED